VHHLFVRAAPLYMQEFSSWHAEHHMHVQALHAYMRTLLKRTVALSHVPGIYATQCRLCRPHVSSSTVVMAGADKPLVELAQQAAAALESAVPPTPQILPELQVTGQQTYATDQAAALCWWLTSRMASLRPWHVSPAPTCNTGNQQLLAHVQQANDMLPNPTSLAPSLPPLQRKTSTMSCGRATAMLSCPTTLSSGRRYGSASWSPCSARLPW
jgi:hypothetical protein